MFDGPAALIIIEAFGAAGRPVQPWESHAVFFAFKNSELRLLPILVYTLCSGGKQAGSSL